MDNSKNYVSKYAFIFFKNCLIFPLTLLPAYPLWTGNLTWQMSQKVGGNFGSLFYIFQRQKENALSVSLVIEVTIEYFKFLGTYLNVKP